MPDVRSSLMLSNHASMMSVAAPSLCILHLTIMYFVVAEVVKVTLYRVQSVVVGTPTVGFATACVPSAFRSDAISCAPVVAVPEIALHLFSLSYLFRLLLDA